MELIPRRPFGRELTTLRKEMDELMTRFFGESLFGRRWAEEWSPSLDLTETKDTFLVKVELPGLDAKDVDVSISANVLTIKGEKKKEEEEKEEQHHYVERYYGAFQRSFQLPANVKEDKIDATFEKGVLKITLPKTAEAKKKQIEIKVK